jgi:hypothetical protein
VDATNNSATLDLRPATAGSCFVTEQLPASSTNAWVYSHDHGSVVIGANRMRVRRSMGELGRRFAVVADYANAQTPKIRRCDGVVIAAPASIAMRTEA